MQRGSKGGDHPYKDLNFFTTIIKYSYRVFKVIRIYPW